MQQFWFELGGGLVLSCALQVAPGQPFLRAALSLLLPVILGVMLVVLSMSRSVARAVGGSSGVGVDVGELLLAALIVLAALALVLTATRFLPPSSKWRRYRPLWLGLLSTLLVAGGLIHF